MTPPGARLRALAARWFSATTMERLADPAIADLQAEYDEVSRRGLTWRKRWIWMRGHIAFFRMVVGVGVGLVPGILVAPLRGAPLDFRVGLRLLVKHIGLTVVGTVAMAFAIWSGLIVFEFFTQIVRPTLPLPGGDRIVGIVMADTARGDEAPATLHDFVGWRDALTSVQDLAAYRTRVLNVIVGSAPAEPVDVAEISAAAFRVADVHPALGRPLAEDDEKPAARPVVVIGHDVWETRFGSAADVIGSELRLGNVPHTVVGVMPKGFGFPVAHGFWVPLRLNPVDYARRQSPALRVFGRLAPGATRASAQPELSVLGAGAAAAFPDTHRHLKPRVVPYVDAVFRIFSPGKILALVSVNLLGVSLVFLVCGNVALLMFARAATRENEILVRSALGASRRRIMGQLFVEALVLAAVAGAFALTFAGFGWRWVFEVFAVTTFEGRGVPFWLHPTLSPGTLLYAVLLTLLAAVIAGLLPGFKVTRAIGTRLRQAGPGGGGLRFGGIWTGLIVTEVAVMAIAPLFLFVIEGETARAIHAIEAGVRTEHYLAATIAMDRNRVPGASGATFAARFTAASQELERRLQAEPGVTGVTVADLLPLMDHPPQKIDIDAGGAAPFDPDYSYRRVSSARVALNFFDVLDAPILSGRAFHSGDLRPDARTVIVNQSFVRLVLGGRNPIGRRLRYRAFFEEPPGARSTNEPWHQIVGVVPDLGIAPEERDPKRARIYHPLVPGEQYPVHMAVQTRGDPVLFASRLRSVATGVDPTLQLQEIIRLDQVKDPGLRLLRLLFWIAVVLTSVVLLLSLSGIYAVLSFIASQRTREVGIRVALGGRPRHVVAVMFRRPLAQIVLGILIGLVVANGLSEGNDLRVVALYGCVILVISSLAIVGPVRRALRVQPVEALRAE